MVVSTKGRYALRVMIDIAKSGKDSYVTLSGIAERQGLSEKYLESIIKMLVQNTSGAGTMLPAPRTAATSSRAIPRRSRHGTSSPLLRTTSTS